MPVVRDYWRGVLDRLQADVDSLSKLVKHAGERGRANEVALTQLLELFVPRRLDVSTGLLIDRDDRYSKQMDIVVTERSDEPAVLAQTTQLLHPVEVVLACIEVKTMLRGDDIEDCRRKKVSLNALQSCAAHADGTASPLFFVLAYSTSLRPESVAKRIRDLGDAERPDVLCILDPPIFMEKDSEHSGVVLVLDDLSEDTATAVRASDPTARDQERDGRRYPLLEWKSTTYLGDPGRALLLFIEALARLTAEKQGRPVPVLTSYLDDRMRHAAPL